MNKQKIKTTNHTTGSIHSTSRDKNIPLEFLPSWSKQKLVRCSQSQNLTVKFWNKSVDSHKATMLQSDKVPVIYANYGPATTNMWNE